VNNKRVIATEAGLRADRELDIMLDLRKKIKGVKKQLEQTKINGDKAEEGVLITGLSKLETELGKVTAKEMKERKLALYARKELDLAELNLARQSDLEQEVDVRVGEERIKLQGITNARVNKERRTVKRMEETRVQKAEQLLSSMNEIKSLASKQIEDSLQANMIARERMREINTSNDILQQTLDNIEKLNHDRKAASFMQLKNNISKAMKEVCDKNDLAAKKENKLRAEEKREKNSLLAAGENPYEIFRRRRLDTEKAKAIEKLIKKEKTEEMRIAERMVAEDQYLHKRYYIYIYYIFIDILSLCFSISFPLRLCLYIQCSLVVQGGH
jgi:hypothetical protein